MDEMHHIFLVPGFFGFANLGEILYFAHVKDFLPRACAEAGLQVQVHAVNTYPTSSIRRRAARLADFIAEQTAGADVPIHLIGHSSGGLDARLLVTPGASLQTAQDAEAIAARVRSVVMVSTPNHGTPVASFFTSVFGQKLLQLLSLGTIYTLWFGRLPASALFRLGALFARADDLVGLKNNILDQLYAQLLEDFSPERRQEVEHFMTEVWSDQALLPQLTPEGIDVLNAATSNRAGVRYGSVVHYARRPGVVSTASVGLDPYGQTTHALFYGLYRLASRMPTEHLPRLDQQQADALLHAYGTFPDPAANDGVVPTLSQVWGEVIHATRADHLDVLGHFGGPPEHEPPHVDWLSSGAGFERQHFEALWLDVVRFIAGRKPLVSRPSSSRGQHLLHLFRRR